MSEHIDCFWFECFACEGGTECENCCYALTSEDPRYQEWIELYDLYVKEALDQVYGFFKRRLKEHKLTIDGKPLLK